jgi:hypothetical protein
MAQCASRGHRPAVRSGAGDGDADGRVVAASAAKACPAGAGAVKVYLGRAVSGELGPRSLEAIQLAHRALREFGASILAERVADPDYRPGLDRPELIAEMMRRELLEADAGCMEMTGRSSGVGFEAGWLLGRGRPVLALYDADAPPASAVVRFPPFDHCVAFGYRDLMEVGGAVTDFCRTIAAHAAYRAEG